MVFITRKKKIESIVKMDKGSIGYVISGKHTGRNGKIEEIVERGGKKLAKIKGEEGEMMVWVKNVIAMEK